MELRGKVLKTWHFGTFIHWQFFPFDLIARGLEDVPCSNADLITENTYLLELFNTIYIYVDGRGDPIGPSREGSKKTSAIRALRGRER